MIYNIILKKNSSKKPAFTLVEILVAISILAVVLLLISRIYFSISDSQKRFSGENLVQSDIEYFVRMASNNIKLAQKSDGILCAIPENKFFDLNATSSSLAFIKDGECLEFYLVDDNGVGRIKFYDSTLVTDQFITSSNTNILSLVFAVEDNIETGQPIVTILLKAAPVGSVDNFIYIQNTISVLENVVEVSGEPVDFVCGDDIYDSECNVYGTVEIGTQCWMSENLAYLPEVHDNRDFEERGSSQEPGYGVYDYNDRDLPSAKLHEHYQIYGVLYNWYAVNQVSICPVGWSVPTDTQLTTLITYLGGESEAGGYMKEAGTAHWNSPNEGATNESYFTALPGGLRGTDGSFFSLGEYGLFWSSSVNGDDAWDMGLSHVSAEVGLDGNARGLGFSVRCIKD